MGKQGEAVPQDVGPAAGPHAAAPVPQAAEARPAAAVAAGAVPGKVAATPAARRLAAEQGIDIASLTPSGSHGELRARDIPVTAPVAASPLAKKVAAEAGISLAGVKGSGPGGRVVRADVAGAAAAPAHAAAAPAHAAAAPATPQAPVAMANGDTRVPLTQIQRITGRRTLQAHLEIPPVTIHGKADVTDLLSLRERMNATGPVKTSVNDWILKAVAKALVANPRANAVLDGNDVIYRKAIDIGMAVATPRGLLVPVVRGVDALGIGELAARTRDLAERAREGKLTPKEMEPGTFSVSNMGMYGVTAFTPIINQPQVAILGACAIEQELKLVGGQVVARSFMGLSLTFDHRVLDGAEAALYLKSLRELMESPLTMLM
jgi:pyruvate dehydrogenase E2 component (dihydrolipoamide acetyltransferase)